MTHWHHEKHQRFTYRLLLRRKDEEKQLLIICYHNSYVPLLSNHSSLNIFIRRGLMNHNCFQVISKLQSSSHCESVTTQMNDENRGRKEILATKFEFSVKPERGTATARSHTNRAFISELPSYPRPCAARLCLCLPRTRVREVIAGAWE